MIYPSKAFPSEASPVTGTVMVSVASPRTSLVIRKSSEISVSDGQNYPESSDDLMEP